MNSVFCLTLLFVAFSTATTKNFNTNNRLVYGSWHVCDTCRCDYFNLYAIEYSTTNPSDTTPPHYLYYSHSASNSCTSTYTYEWLQITNNVTGLVISQSGRSAELVISNLIDSSNQIVSISLSWPTVDEHNTNNCNCQSSYSSGIESLRVIAKLSYRVADLTGSVKINNNVYTVPTDTYSYISTVGQKTIVLKNH